MPVSSAPEVDFFFSSAKTANFSSPSPNPVKWAPNEDYFFESNNHKQREVASNPTILRARQLPSPFPNTGQLASPHTQLTVMSLVVCASFPHLCVLLPHPSSFASVHVRLNG